jgi:hypothetical protein
MAPMMKKILILTLLLILHQLSALRPSYCATIRSFSVSPTSISLPDQDPDTFPEVSSQTNLIVGVSIRQLSSAENWVLELYSDGDLISGSDSIPIGNVRWTVTGSGSPPGTFQNRNFVRGAYIEAGRGPGDKPGNGKADITCYFTFYLSNLWSYATGNYSKTITLRLTVPGAVQSLTFTLSTSITARASLQFGGLTISFPDADPDSTPSIPASVNPISVTSNMRTGSSSTSTLSCLASGDLVSGGNTIPITNMSWQATGSGYVPGTMSQTIGQTAGNWTGPGTRVGAFNYFLANSWSYAPGVYSSGVTYTLTAP